MGVKEKIPETDSRMNKASSVSTGNAAVPYAGNFHLLVEEEIRKKTKNE